jgi:2-haloacid dehalogenase
MYKPSPVVYQMAAEEAGVEKSNIGFVSSNYWDIAGAVTYGFQPFWINRGGLVPDELGLPAVTTLDTLAGLVGLCKSSPSPPGTGSSA